MNVDLYIASPSKWLGASKYDTTPLCETCRGAVFCKKICKYRNTTIKEFLDERGVSYGKEDKR